MKPMKLLLAALAGVAATTIGALAWLAAGGFNFAADVPHSHAVYALIDFARDRSVDVRSGGIKAPPLDDPKLIAKGASEYGAMCEGCHLGPGIGDNEFRRGLYPQPPDLSKPDGSDEDESAEWFWVIKHGIKGSAMPAWGLTHDDATIWSIVAFIRTLPQLTPEQYHQQTADAAEHHTD